MVSMKCFFSVLSWAKRSASGSSLRVSLVGVWRRCSFNSLSLNAWAWILSRSSPPRRSKFSTCWALGRYQLSTDQLGTQLDPPTHWNPDFPSIDELPPTFAVRPLVVISIVGEVAKDP